MNSYRAIYLGDDKWVVRQFQDGKCFEKQITMHVEDPELRSSDRKAISAALADNRDWVQV